MTRALLALVFVLTLTGCAATNELRGDEVVVIHNGEQYWARMRGHRAKVLRPVRFSDWQASDSKALSR